jgi:TRAP-type mannitol/chloroaromatic compound transport system permease small subunit
MTTKTQILVNITLVLCFAFTCYITLQTYKEVKRDLRYITQSQKTQESKVDILNEYFYLFIEKDIEYQIKRRKVLSILEKAASDYQKEKESLNTF